jgi:hypothetical protein
MMRRTKSSRVAIRKRTGETKTTKRLKRVTRKRRQSRVEMSRRAMQGKAMVTRRQTRTT